MPVAAINSAGVVGWRMHTGTIGTIEGPLSVSCFASHLRLSNICAPGNHAHLHGGRPDVGMGAVHGAIRRND